MSAPFHFVREFVVRLDYGNVTYEELAKMELPVGDDIKDAVDNYIADELARDPEMTAPLTAPLSVTADDGTDQHGEAT